MLLDAAPVVGDRSIDIVAGGRKKAQETSHAKTQDANLSGRTLEFVGGGHGRRDVADTAVHVKGLVELERSLPLFIVECVHVDAVLNAPEKVWRHCDVAERRELCAGGAQVCIHP